MKKIFHSEEEEELAQAAQRALGALSLDVFKARLDGALKPALLHDELAHSRRLELDDLQFPFNPRHSVIFQQLKKNQNPRD